MRPGTASWPRCSATSCLRPAANRNSPSRRSTVSASTSAAFCRPLQRAHLGPREEPRAGQRSPQDSKDQSIRRSRQKGTAQMPHGQSKPRQGVGLGGVTNDDRWVVLHRASVWIPRNAPFSSRSAGPNRRQFATRSQDDRRIVRPAMDGCAICLWQALGFARAIAQAHWLLTMRRIERLRPPRARAAWLSCGKIGLRYRPRPCGRQSSAIPPSRGRG